MSKRIMTGQKRDGSEGFYLDKEGRKQDAEFWQEMLGDDILPEELQAKPRKPRTVVDLIKKQQLVWAAQAGICPDEDGYCTTLDQNLFRPLSALSRADLLAGDGGELGKNNERGKAQALHSSALLACNFFDYWRGRDLSTLATLFGVADLCGLRFEAKFPTGMRGKAPNLDVVLYERTGGVLAIESKFTEPFRRSKTKGFLKPKYFDNSDTWSRVGLSGCQVLADDLRANPSQFELLDVAQLLKHMLGLATQQDAWRLCCLWYRPSGAMGDQHAAELDRFAQRIGSDAKRFFSVTYQEAFRRLGDLIGPEHSEYRHYLRDRYFVTAV
jgi:hypothetical protein